MFYITELYDWSELELYKWIYYAIYIYMYIIYIYTYVVSAYFVYLRGNTGPWKKGEWASSCWAILVLPWKLWCGIWWKNPDNAIAWKDTHDTKSA